MHTLSKRCLLIFVLGLLAAGCGRVLNPPAGSSPEGTAAADSSYRLASEPAGAKDVKVARNDAKDMEEVVIVGRVGGDQNPWVEGLAAFTIVDLSLKPCEEGCQTPWDYCCDTDLLPSSKAMVKIVDAQGRTIANDSRSLLGIKESQTVVVRGKAKRDEAGNLTVLGDGVFVRP
ncbi:MAG: hypothetical protein A2V98_21100 [Planctomycetes bacterium RBG_16_64_12]|nr:MAG: hypothetical protein A2V98_21100 [Planctomycetes bacterium RBG_16_64_12]